MENEPTPPQPTPSLEELHAAQLGFLKENYSQAKAYFNLVIVAGYAGFFGLWKLADQNLSDGEKLWSALLLSVSLTSFVAWEVGQMIFTSRSMVGIAEATKDLPDFGRLIMEHGEREKERIRKLIHWWRIALLLTIFPAVGGAGILMWAFVAGLLRLYLPCGSSG